MRALLLCLVMSAGLGAAATADVLPQGSKKPSLIELLERYRGGDHQVAVDAILARGDLRTLRREFQREVPGWASGVDEPGAGKRRLVAASVALELAGRQRTEWVESRHFIEWACRLLRSAPPEPAERLWHGAVLYLAQGVGDPAFLLGRPYLKSDLVWLTEVFGRASPPRGHLDHAESRFPVELRYRLARVVASEFESTPGPRRPVWIDEQSARAGFTQITATSLGDDRSGGMAPTAIAASRWSRHYVQLWNIVHLAMPLLKDDALEAEARVRLGYTYARLNRPDLALEQWRAVTSLTTDPFLLYLAMYFSGQAHFAVGDRPSAIAAYRSAFGLVPAQSAGLALASLLFAGNERREAITLVDMILGRKDPEPDPWRLYAAGDLRLWPALMDALRAAQQ